MSAAERTGLGPDLPAGAALTILVATLTYHRPDDLAELIPHLRSQARRSSDRVGLLVVDNDPDGGARSIVDAADGVRYEHERRPGIAAARNRALDVALETGADLLVFIDDDERPTAAWLERLVATWRVDRPAAVVGPVVSEFAVPPEPWVAAGRFFDRRRMPTGTRTDVAATNNLLVDLRFVRSAGLRFDERFGLTGGEDTLFTRALHAAGGSLVWCDEAIVTDVVPPERVSRRWVLARAYSSGNSHVLTALHLTERRRDRALLRGRLAARAVVRVAGGSGRAALGTITGRPAHQARGLRTLARGRGMLAALLGSAYSEYGRG